MHTRIADQMNFMKVERTCTSGIASITQPEEIQHLTAAM
jgi:hypothetical protein